MKSEQEFAPHLRILHLEDNPMDAELLVSILIEAGMSCDVFRVDTRPDFVAALQQRDFDIIISDLSLPAFNGRAALEIAREQYPDVPFIFVSGTIGEEAAIESLLSGATDYVLKHRFSRLIPAVQRAQREAEERKKQRRTERELARTSTQLQHLFDNLDDVFFSFDTIQSKLLQVSPSCERISGLPANSFLSDPRFWESCIHDEDKTAAKGLLAKVRKGKSIQCECRVVHRDGTVRWIEARLKPVIDQVGKLVRVDGVLSDVSERKRSEEALRASEERYRQLFESNPHPMWVYDVETLAFLAVNDAAVEGYGYSRSEFLRMNIQDIRPSEDHGRGLEVSASLRHRKKDGRIIDVEIASHDLFYSERAACLVLASDISDKKRIEAQLLRAQRIESIGSLASGIAHDLNNILAPILMGVQLLREKTGDDPVIDIMELSARRGADLVKQVLTFARGIDGRGQLQIRHLLGEIEKILTQTLPKSIQLESKIQTQLWVVSGDGTQLHQLFMNLCINARDAMTNGGVLTLSARNVTIDRASKGRFEITPGSYVAIEVSDTGEGIPRELLDKIFEPFFTTKDPGKGTGLGLSTVQMIAKSHGAYLDVSTAVGKGSTFAVFLTATPAAKASTDRDKLQSLPSGNGELILIVDDEDAIRDITTATLEAYGYNTLSASNGSQGLDIFREHCGKIQVVVSDMNMPLMDGERMIQLMEAMNPCLRVVGSSGMGQEPTSVSLTPPVARRISLKKPFTAEELLQALSTVLKAT